jgi:AraC-like DNA-binding protein
VKAARPPSEEVSWAWDKLKSTGGLISIGALAEDLGWSRKHLIHRFRGQVGMPPKTVARLLRFHAALEQLKRSDGTRWVEIAHSCGYYDQAHLIRDFRDFAGCAPGEFLGRLLPEGGGVSGL